MTKRKIFYGITLGLILSLLCGQRQGFAELPPQSNDDLKALRSDIDALKAGQAQIRKQIQEIKTLAQSQQAKPRPSAVGTVVSVKGAVFKGDAKAKVTILEFSEYQCPFCAVYANDAMHQIEKEYVETGKVKYVFRDFPLVRIHPLAFKAAEASRCAADQGKYWEMHTQLFANSSALTPDDLSRHAAAIGLDVPTFQKCLASGKHAPGINQDLQDGEKVGLTATPFFLIGLTEPDGSGLKVATVFGGARPFETFKEAINSLLAPTQPAK